MNPLTIVRFIFPTTGGAFMTIKGFFGLVISDGKSLLIINKG